MSIIPYTKHNVTEEDISSVTEVLKSSNLTQGRSVRDFEDAFCKIVGADYSLAVSNGTAALHLSALALGLSRGDRVLCTALSFVASANCAKYCGAEVDFVDIDPLTLCMDLSRLKLILERKCTGYYKGIIVVDFAGLPVDSEKLSEIASEHNLWVLEDACHAAGANYLSEKNEKITVGDCKHADITVFSFHPAKHIATGEGGMITTNNSKIFKKLTQLRSHSIEKSVESMPGWFYEINEIGYNYRISDIQCALGLSQLKRLGNSVVKRNKIAKRYCELLKGLPLEIPKVAKDKLHAFHLFIIRAERRDELYDFLKLNNVFCQVHYIPIYKHKIYEKNSNKDLFPECEKYYQECLSLPMFPTLKEEEVDKVANLIKIFYD